MVFRFTILALLIFNPLIASAQIAARDLAIDTDAVAPKRFLAAKGRKALLEGYSSQSLEGWIYPFQIFDGLEVSFEHASTGRAPGSSLLRRVIYRPESATRIYSAQGFTVVETLFVPLDEPGLTIRYEVRGTDAVDVTVEFHPVLNLMWPAGIGGQDVSWRDDKKAFRLAEGSGRFFALIGSRETVAHAEPNTYREPWRTQRRLFLTMRAAPSATLAVSLDLPEHYNAEATYSLLLENYPRLESEAKRHYEELAQSTVSLATPDAAVDRAFAWAKVAVDQAWICNPYLGCGLAGGYGPSRDTRRPQYAWFFAGDGLRTIDGLESCGNHALAKEAYKFLSRYQDPRTGMMWHEISQSASFLNWFTSPWAFAHVDISLQYLSQFQRTLDWTGDREELRAQWPSLEAAWRYAVSLLDSNTGLPRIPAGKQGQNEQNPMVEELSLSSGWVAAAKAYGAMAEQIGSAAPARDAEQRAARARDALVSRYWNKEKNFFVVGLRPDGAPLTQQMSSAITPILQRTVPNTYANIALDRMASAAFMTDWGVRSIPVDDAAFRPSSYAGGSVWAVSTGAAARAFWSFHRPLTALPLWRALIEESFADSPGHVDEVFSGNSFRELDVSVPEQSWSSAALLTATVEGLWGLEPDALHHRLTVTPHLPPGWDSTAIRNIRVGETTLGLEMSRSPGLIALHVTSAGLPLELAFAPEIPQGSGELAATLNGRPAPVELQQHADDWHAAISLAAKGESQVEIRFKPGVTAEIPAPPLRIGAPSERLRVLHSSWNDRTLELTFEVADGTCPTLILHTPWQPVSVEGGTLANKTSQRLTLQVGKCGDTVGAYHRATLRVRFPA